jgi:hypothetical protein
MVAVVVTEPVVAVVPVVGPPAPPVVVRLGPWSVSDAHEKSVSPETKSNAIADPDKEVFRLMVRVSENGRLGGKGVAAVPGPEWPRAAGPMKKSAPPAREDLFAVVIFKARSTRRGATSMR